MRLRHKLRSDFLIPISLQTKVVDLRYFKTIKSVRYEIIQVQNIKGLDHQVAKIQGLANFCLWQQLNSFTMRSLQKNISVDFFQICVYWIPTRNPCSLSSQTLAPGTINNIVMQNAEAYTGGSSGAQHWISKSIVFRRFSGSNGC